MLLPRVIDGGRGAGARADSPPAAAICRGAVGSLWSPITGPWAAPDPRRVPRAPAGPAARALTGGDWAPVLVAVGTLASGAPIPVTLREPGCSGGPRQQAGRPQGVPGSGAADPQRDGQLRRRISDLGEQGWPQDIVGQDRPGRGGFPQPQRAGGSSWPRPLAARRLRCRSHFLADPGPALAGSRQPRRGVSLLVVTPESALGRATTAAVRSATTRDGGQQHGLVRSSGASSILLLYASSCVRKSCFSARSLHHLGVERLADASLSGPSAQHDPMASTIGTEPCGQVIAESISEYPRLRPTGRPSGAPISCRMMAPPGVLLPHRQPEDQQPDEGRSASSRRESASDRGD